MADRTYRRGFRDPYDRDRSFSRQAEQFDPAGQSWRDEERGYGQMGEGWRDEDYGSFDTAGRSDSRESGRDPMAERYRAGRSFGYGGYGMRSYRDRSGDNPNRENRDYRDTWSTGAGSRLAANHGEWRDSDLRGSNERGWFERAGDEVASWFGDDEAARRRAQDDHTGYGPAGYVRSDERILEDACDELTDDWGVDARQIQVTVANGDITLEGTVPSRDQKRRAEACVEDISGVKNVQNNLRVQDSAGWDRNRGGESTGAA